MNCKHTRRGFTQIKWIERHNSNLASQGREITARGFTLIELLVVVLIIGILVAVAVPQYQKAVAKSRYMQLITAGRAIKNAMETYYLEHGNYPSYWNELDIEFSNCIDHGKESILCCDTFVVDMYFGTDKNLYFQDVTPGYDKTSISRADYGSSSAYTVWLDHSSHPRKTQCSSSIRGLCASLGF